MIISILLLTFSCTSEHFLSKIEPDLDCFLQLKHGTFFEIAFAFELSGIFAKIPLI